MSLKFLKYSNPIEIAEFVTTLGLKNEPAFPWWVPYTFKKRYNIISLVNSRVQKRNHKFGIQILNNIKEAISLEENNVKKSVAGCLWEIYVPGRCSL